jgi:hypothetical protein
VCGRCSKDSCKAGHTFDKKTGQCVTFGIILSSNKKDVVALTYEGQIEAVKHFAVPAILPPTITVVKVEPEILAEIAKTEVVGEPIGHVIPASTSHVAAMIELFDENLIKCRERGGTWDAKGKKCIEAVAQVEQVAQVVLSPDQKQIVAVVSDEGEVKKLAHPIEAPVAVPEAAQAHPSPEVLKHAEVIATPNISSVLAAVRDCQESGGKWDKKKNECWSFNPETGQRGPHVDNMQLKAMFSQRASECEVSGGRWDRETSSCIPAAVVLSPDKSEVIAIVTAEGEVQALAEPIPAPPALPESAIAHPPASILKEIAQVDKTGTPTEHVKIASLSMNEVFAAVRSCTESGGKWNKKTQTCVMEKVILSADKTEIIGVQEESGAVAALADPIPLPPNAPIPDFLVAKVSSSVVKKIEKVEDSGVPSADIAIVAPPSGGRLGLLDAIQKGKHLKKVTCPSGEEWKDGRCVKLAGGDLLSAIRGGAKLRKASERGHQSVPSGRYSPEMERILARGKALASEEPEEESGDW